MGTGEQLYIDLYQNKVRRKNLDMARIEYKKAYDMVPQNWIKKNVAKCIKYQMKS